MSDFNRNQNELKEFEKRHSKDNFIKATLLIIMFLELCLILYLLLVTGKNVEKAILPSLIIGGIISLIASLVY